MIPNATHNSNVLRRIEYQYDEGTPPSVAIVQAIAALEDMDPVDLPADLEIKLYDHVDPTALNRLVTENGDNTVTVDLTIHNEHRYAVEIRNDGQLTVQKTG